MLEKIVLLAFGFFSFIAFVLYGVDKHRAINHKWRIPEATLLLISSVGGVGALLGMIVFRHKTRKLKFRILVPLFMIIDLLIAGFFWWTADYYYPGVATIEAIQSDDDVKVEDYKSYYLFNGPSDDRTLIFYPGAKVDEKAYAPLLHEIAATTMDVYLVKMPFRLAFLGFNSAGTIVENSFYNEYYIGGHSLGGAVASYYAAKHEVSFKGLFLLAAYPVKQTTLDTLLIYGSEDRILNMDHVNAAKDMVTGRFEEFVIKGGNHAQFGDYNLQKGDGEAKISPEEQREVTIERFSDFFPPTSEDDNKKK